MDSSLPPLLTPSTFTVVQLPSPIIDSYVHHAPLATTDMLPLAVQGMTLAQHPSCMSFPFSDQQLPPPTEAFLTEAFPTEAFSLTEQQAFTDMLHFYTPSSAAENAAAAAETAAAAAETAPAAAETAPAAPTSHSQQAPSMPAPGTLSQLGPSLQPGNGANAGIRVLSDCQGSAQAQHLYSGDGEVFVSSGVCDSAVQCSANGRTVMQGEANWAPVASASGERECAAAAAAATSGSGSRSRAVSDTSGSGSVPVLDMRGSRAGSGSRFRERMEESSAVSARPREEAGGMEGGLEPGSNSRQRADISPRMERLRHKAVLLKAGIMNANEQAVMGLLADVSEGERLRFGFHSFHLFIFDFIFIFIIILYFITFCMPM